MPDKLFAVAGFELRVGLRNRWVLTAVSVLSLFAVVLAYTGSTPVGSTKVDGLTVLTVSLVSLSVYIVPLLSLLLAFDAFAGERERGTFALLLTYPVRRSSIVLGKFLGHSVIIGSAIIIGFSIAAAMVAADSGTSPAGLAALTRLGVTALLLGMTFLAIGYVLSSCVRQTATAAALAIGVWLVMIVLYDLALLGALVADDGGAFTKHVFPWLLVGNPADGFRLFNMVSLPEAGLDLGPSLARNDGGPSAGTALVILICWMGGALLFAVDRIRRIEP